LKRATSGSAGTRRSVAVVPFGARSEDPRAGAWGRQIARRLVDRFADDPALDLKPVFLVAMGDQPSDAGYLVFGSTPGPALAAQYGASLGTTHALVGVLRADGADRALEATLVDVAAKRGIATLAYQIGPGALAGAEPALAEWLATALAHRRSAGRAADGGAGIRRPPRGDGRRGERHAPLRKRRPRCR